jgi:2-dehydropantoate 2-reductase
VAARRDADVVLFGVKSLDTEETARELARHARPDTPVVSLQNGVYNVARIRATSRLDPVAAVVYVASSMPAPGRVEHAGRGDLLIGDLRGRLHPPRAAALSRLSAWFEAAGVPCRVSPDIEADLWVKLITNAALNPISAVANATYGAIAAQSDSRETIRQLVEECVAVARAGGVSLPDTGYVDIVWRFAEKVDAACSSTSQVPRTPQADRMDARTESVVRRRSELGVPTSVNRSLLALLKLREAQF